MKRFKVISIIAIAVLSAICIFQQIELYAIADEINRINEFIENQLDVNDAIVDVFDYLMD